MSNMVASALLAAQAKIMPNFTEAEMRERQNPILRVGLANQNYVMIDVKSIKESTKRSIKGYQFVKGANGTGTTRPATFSGAQGDTAEVTLSWSTLTENFDIYGSVGEDNILSTVDLIKNSFQQRFRSFRERLGKGLVTSLHAGRTAVGNTVVRNVVGGAINGSNNAFEIANENQFFAYLKSVMEQHKYYGGLDVMVDSVLDPIARRIAAQGGGNSSNLAYQLQGMNIMPHDVLGTDVAVSAYANGGIALALPQNSFAFIPWIPSKYRKGDGDVASVNGKKFVMPDDTGLPIEYAVHAYTEKADGSSYGGTTDDLVTHFQISCDVATQVAYVSNSNETPIYEFALVP